MPLIKVEQITLEAIKTIQHRIVTLHPISLLQYYLGSAKYCLQVQF